MKIDFNTPIKTTYCVDNEHRLNNIQYSINAVSERIQPDIISNTEKVAVVCFGPSLNETWKKLKDFKYIITCSGAHKFLIERGIVPTWHVEVDPREHKVDLLGDPHPNVEYLFATTVHPKLIDATKGYNVKLWHVFPDTPLQKLPNHIPRGEWVFLGGSTVGLRSLAIAKFLGFKEIHIFGMDCSYPPNNLGEHASIHPNPAKASNRVSIDFDGTTYETTVSLLSYAKEFFIQRNLLGDCDLLFYGNGLLQHMIQAQWKPSEKDIKDRDVSILAVYIPKLFSDDYLNLNKQLHSINSSYGSSGHKRLTDVLKLSKKYNTTDILDYGCGKGTLANSMPFPIKEYDPAISGKDITPFPADIVICTDVLEHIEPEYLDNVLGDLQRLIKKIGFFVIHTGAAIKQLPDGRNTHLIQQSRSWWWKRINQFFEIDEMEEHGQELFVYVTQKHSIEEQPKLGNKLVFQYVENNGIKFNVVNGYTEWRVNSLLTKEPVTIEWINSFDKNDIFVDVGANVGVYTLWAAKKGIQVFAFEPESQNYALLNQNIFLNKFDNIKAYCCAISDSFSIADLNITEFTPGSSCHQYNSTNNHNGQKGVFEYSQGSISISLDTLIGMQMIPQPDHIKIDVDGFEHLVVKGAKNTIKNVKSILVEVNTNLHLHKEMINSLVSLGFKYDHHQVSKSIRKDGPFKGVGEYVFYRNKTL
jgi:FkbM family methyltransferase